VDGEVLPLELINGSTTLISDRLTFGHRILHPQSLSY
jgi:glycyl-tRNA synthetase beta chain